MLCWFEVPPISSVEGVDIDSLGNVDRLAKGRDFSQGSLDSVENRIHNTGAQFN